MLGKLYIIPGWKETCRRKPYQQLKEIAQSKGYSVECVKINWNVPLSNQLFNIPSNSVIFGFSLGAVFAWMIAQNSTCKHLILASMTPLNTFKRGEQKKLLIEVLGKDIVNDISSNIKENNKSKKQTILYGEKELDGEYFDLLVPDTGHQLTIEYLKALNKLI